MEGFGSASNADGTTGSTNTVDAVWVHNSCFRQTVLDFLGMEDPGAGEAAHHIIPVNDGGEGADDLRALLSKLTIHIDDPVNGAIIKSRLHGEIHYFIDD